MFSSNAQRNFFPVQDEHFLHIVDKNLKNMNKILKFQTFIDIYIGSRYSSSWVRNSYSSPPSILPSMHRNFTFRQCCLISNAKRDRKKIYNRRKKYFMLCKIINVKTQSKIHIKYKFSCLMTYIFIFLCQILRSESIGM